MEYTIAGAAEISLPDGSSYITDQHDLFCYHPDTPQYYNVHSGHGFWKHHWVTFILPPTSHNLEHWRELSPGLYLYSLPETVVRRRVLSLMEEIAGRTHIHRPNWRLLQRNLLEQVFLWCLVDPDRQKPIDKRISLALRMMEKHFHEPLDVDRLAATANISPSRFAHIFREAIGTSPIAYLEQMRIEKAKMLLLSTTSKISSISLECGYPDPYHFSRVFKRLTGTSPSHYRNGTTS